MWGIFIAIEAIIKPSCLRVESAIIFLRSISEVAARPAIIIVVLAVNKRIK